MSRTAVLLTVIALLGASACSDSGDSSPPDSVATGGETTTTTATTTPGPDSLPPVTFLSDPVEAGPLLGSGARDVEGDAVAPTAVEPCLDDEEICEDYPDEFDVPPERPPFIPAPADAAFCAVLADLEERPFPSDEYEAIVVVRAWFAELAPTVPAAYTADFAVLTDWLDRAVAADGEITFDDEYSDEVDAASDRLGEYVDTKCYGYGANNPDPPTTDPDVSTTLPEPPGTDFVPPTTTSDVEEEPAGPLFGLRAMDEFDETGVPTTGPFERTGDAVAFCALLDEIAERYFPTDEFEGLLVAQAWLVELRPLVPEVVADAFLALEQLLQVLIDAEIAGDEPEPFFAEFDDAVTELNEYADTNCYGY